MERNERSKSPDFYRRKRLRCSNYSNHERNVLIHIIEKYQEVLESKKLDKNSVLERDAVWDVIAREFNDIVLNEPGRTARQLKQCYDNLKRRIKKESGSNEFEAAKVYVEPNILVLDHDRGRSTTPVTSDESSSSIHNRGCTTTSSFQDSTSRETPSRYPTESHPFENGDTEPASEELRRKNPDIAKLQRTLLTKQIQAVTMELEMKVKKYELELQVEQAKLDYYKKKCELLTRPV